MCRDDQEPVAAAVATQAVGGRHHPTPLSAARARASAARARARLPKPQILFLFCPPLAMLDDGYVPLNYCDCIIPKIM